MHIESSVDELERLLEAEQIAEIKKDMPPKGSAREQLKAFRERWAIKKHINATAHNIALKRKSGIYGPADRKMERDYNRAMNFGKVYSHTYIKYACALLGILVLLGL